MGYKPLKLIVTAWPVQIDVLQRGNPPFLSKEAVNNGFYRVSYKAIRM